MPIAVSPYNGSHFTMLKMMEGFIKRDEIKITNAGTDAPADRGADAGKVAAQPAGAVDQRRREAGPRVIMESHSTRSEAAGDELDGPTLRKMFARRGRGRRGDREEPGEVRALPRRGGRRPDRAEGPASSSRILNAPPEPYTRERFEHTYDWTRDWGLVPPGATYENTVDNRAWQ